MSKLLHKRLPKCKGQRTHLKSASLCSETARSLDLPLVDFDYKLFVILSKRSVNTQSIYLYSNTIYKRECCYVGLALLVTMPAA